MRSRPSRPPARRLVALLATGALAVAACGDDDDSADTAPGSTVVEETSAISAGSTTATTEGTETSPASSVPADRCTAEETTATTTAETGSTTAETGDSTATTGSASETSAADTTAPETTLGDTTVPETTAAGFRRPATTPSADDASVTVSAVLEPTSLDIIATAGAALDQVLLDNVYETLLKLGPDGEVGPGLAELPELSADATVYTFTLQDGPTFHSGEPLVAADVVWTLEQQMAPDANETARLANVDTVEATDERTVVVTLCQPDFDFSYLMTRRAGAVLQADATGLQNTANGTGPFVFEDWNVGASITLTRNDDYWGAAPAVGGVTFQYFTDQNAMVNALTTGDVDIVTGIQSDLLAPLEADPQYVVNQGSTNGEFTLGFNNEREPFTDPTVRKAIRQAIDKEGYLELNNGIGTIIGGPVPPTDPWYEDLTDTAPFDLEASRAALEAAGYADGFDVTLSWPNIYAISNAEYVASQLAEVGIDVTIETVEFSVWLEQVYGDKDYDMTAVLHVEPHDILNYANPDYYWQYDSPEVQELIAEAKASPDLAQSEELLKQAARQIAEDSPVDWLLLAADVTVSRREVTGYPTDDTANRFDASGITITE